MISCPRLGSQPVNVPECPVNLEGITPVPSLDWDNYCSSPEYSHKIPIVSTQYIDFDSLTSRLCGLSARVSDQDSEQGSIESVFENTEKMAEMESLKLKLEASMQEIMDEIDDSPPEGIKNGLEIRAEKDLDRLLEMMKKFRVEVRQFLPKCTGDGKDLKVVWENHLKDVVSKTLQHKEHVCLRISSLTSPPTVSQASPDLNKPGDYQNRCLELKQKKLDLELQKISAQTQTKLQAFRDDYDTLVKEIGEDKKEYKDQSNQEISSGMQNLKRWERTVARMTANFLEYDNLASLSNDDERPIAKKEFDFVKKWYDDEKEGLEHEDEVRELYTNLTVAGEKLDYPKYSGAEGEDYDKFIEKLEKVFKHNKVAKVDQLDKLRKCLSGKALTLVPDTMEGVDKALATLKAAFGDPEAILAHRLKKLKTFGSMPTEKKGSGNLFSEREEWFLKIEGVIHDIIQLGKKDPDLAYEAYSKSTINFILALFPIGMMREMQKLEGTRGEKMEAMLKKMGEFREEAREAAKVYGDRLPPREYGTVGRELSGKSSPSPNLRLPTSASPAETQRRTVSDCRVCKQLEADGYGESLYKDHLSSEVIGCPMFIKMNTEERNSIVFKARFCGRCLDKDLVLTTSLSIESTAKVLEMTTAVKGIDASSTSGLASFMRPETPTG